MAKKFRSVSQEVCRFRERERERVIAYFQLIKYPLWRGKSYFYIPHGPVTKDFSKQFLESLKLELKNIARENDAVFIRLDFTPLIPEKTLSGLFTKSPFYTYHSAYFQPRVEWFLNLNKSADQLFKEMHKGARYGVRLAGRRGITTEIVTSNFEKYFSVFYKLMLDTAKRNGFKLHDKIYYQNIFQNLRSDNAYLVIAKYEDKILVIDLVIRYGEVANYVLGGSSNEHRNLMPTYLAQWAAICQAKKLGDAFYNFGGISSGKIYKGWDGLTIFKKKFGGAEMAHSDFFDIVAQPFWYRLYNLRKFLRQFLNQ